MGKTGVVVDNVVFDVAELAEYLHVSNKWIYERTSRKEIPHYKIGGAVRFRRDEIDAWITEHKVPVVI